MAEPAHTGPAGTASAASGGIQSTNETTVPGARRAGVVRGLLIGSKAMVRASDPKAAAVPTLGAFAMADTSSAAGGFVLWKALAGLLGVGVLASALGFMVMLPKTMKEAAVRLVATMAGSALAGPFLVAGAYAKWPEVFGAGVQVAHHVGLEPWFGFFMVAAPLLAMAGLPFWWILGAVVLWFEKRKGQDIGQLAADARADAGKVVSL